jgi:hypothetical protein
MIYNGVLQVKPLMMHGGPFRNYFAHFTSVGTEAMNVFASRLLPGLPQEFCLIN